MIHCINYPEIFGNFELEKLKPFPIAVNSKKRLNEREKYKIFKSQKMALLRISFFFQFLFLEIFTVDDKTEKLKQTKAKQA